LVIERQDPDDRIGRTDEMNYSKRDITIEGITIEGSHFKKRGGKIVDISNILHYRLF
jgi:ribosomal protein L24